ncbi:MAG: SPOR domain-containing protein [Sulfurovum sp.]
MFITIVESSVFIKLGSYSNRANLAKQISNLGYGLSDTAYILEESDMFKAYSSEFNTREEALDKLRIYQEVFPDAYIMESKNVSNLAKSNIYIKPPLYKELIEREKTNIVKADIIKKHIIYEREIENPPKLKKNIALIGVEHSDEIMTPISKDEEDLSLYTVIQDNKFYICPYVIKTSAQKILIEVNFTEDSIVKYRTIIGKIPSMSIPYIIRGEKLYFTRGERVNPYQYTVLDKKLFDYYIVSQWSKGKRISRMRYYIKEENAKSYLNSLQF